MRTKRKLLILSSIMILTLTSFGQNKLVNRWTASGHLRHGKLVPENNKGREYEFLKNGSFNLYKDGIIEGNGTYVLASDAKSILLKDGNQSGSIKIVKLTSTELVMIFSPGKDTMVFYPSGSATTKQTQAKAANYQKLERSWSDLTYNYQRLGDLIENFTKSVEYSTVPGIDKDNAIFKRLATTRAEIAGFDLDLKIITEERFDQYESLQKKYSKDLDGLMEFITKYPKIKESQGYLQRVMQIIDFDPIIMKSKIDFIMAYNKYHGKEILYIK